MEFAILYAIPRGPFWDAFFLGVTKVAGSYGQLWVGIALLLLIFKRTRRAGVSLLIAYIGVFLLGQFGLKNIISRPRPCQIDTAFPLLVSRPSSSSFPSTHSAWAFGGATAIFLQHKKAGIAAYVAAVLIGFSRLYLFLHFPTDVLFGALMGVALGFAVHRITAYAARKLKR